MVRSREQIMQFVQDTGPRADDGLAFLRAEGQAISYTEYSSDISAFAQTPDVARAYMQSYAGLSEPMTEFGIEVRAMRSQEVATRQTTTYMAEQALILDSILDISGTPTLLGLTPEQRQQQIDRLVGVALQSDIELCVIPDAAPLPQFDNVHFMQLSDGTQMAFEERDGGVYKVNDDKVDFFAQGLAELSYVALRGADARDLIQSYR